MGHLIGYAILAAGTAGIVYAFTRRWAADFQRLASASLIAVPPPDEVEELLTESDAIGDGPILVEASELRGLIREAVREAMAAEGRAPSSAGGTRPAP